MGPTFRVFTSGQLESHATLSKTLAIWGVGAKSQEALVLLNASLAAAGEARKLRALLDGYSHATDTTVRKEYFWRAVAWIRSHPRQIQRAMETLRRRYVMGTKRFDDTTRLAARLQPILFAGREIQAHAQIPNGIQAAPKEKGVRPSGSTSPASPLGRHQIIQSLSVTETSDVFLVRDKRTGNRAVIKTLLQRHAGFKDGIRSFKREMDITRFLNHPGVPKVLDSGDDFQLATTGLKSDFPRPYFVMEFVEGLPLDHLTRFGKTLPWQNAKEIFLQLCRVLGAIHALGIEHRDVKSENVILTATETADLVVKLIDFGIAIRRKRGARSRWSRALSDFPPGTPEVVSPERLKSPSQIDYRSDLYSLGILMYETLSGWLPFYGDRERVVHHHLHTVPLLPSQTQPKAKIPPCADAIILKLLQKNPDDRFPSAEALAEAIRNCNE